MLMNEERKQIVEYGRKLFQSGLCKGTAGNISVFDRESGLMAISPSGIDYMDIKVDDIVIMNTSGKVVDGNCKPSSEYNMHLAYMIQATQLPLSMLTRCIVQHLHV